MNSHHLHPHPDGSVSIYTPGLGWWAVCVERWVAERLVQVVAVPGQFV